MRHKPLLAALLIALSLPPLAAAASEKPPAAVSAADADARQQVLLEFDLILDLWREGKYEELYERVTGAKGGKEGFAEKLAEAPRKPACCWQKIQDARAALKGERVAEVEAKLGFEGGVSGTEFVTKRIKLKREDGFWTISESDLFSLAKVSKKRRVYKYLPIQKK